MECDSANNMQNNNTDYEEGSSSRLVKFDFTDSSMQDPKQLADER